MVLFSGYISFERDLYNITVNHRNAGEQHYVLTINARTYQLYKVKTTWVAAGLKDAMARRIGNHLPEEG